MGEGGTVKTSRHVHGRKRGRNEDDVGKSRPSAKRFNSKQHSISTSGSQSDYSETAHGGDMRDVIVEEGSVYFFYRPKVATEHVHAMSNVQRFYMIMQPTEPVRSTARLIVIGKKRLPATNKHERFFGFVEAVGNSIADLTSGLGESVYETKTRGTRKQPAAHALGQGVYNITQHGRGTRLSYKLEVPLQPGEVHQVFEIHQEGSFVLSVKNPKNKPPGAPSAGPDPQYTEEQQEELQGYSWIDAHDTSLLGIEGTEVLLVAARPDPVDRASPTSSSECARHKKGCSEDLDQLFEQLATIVHSALRIIG